MRQSYKGVSWNPQDLMSCKQAYCILLHQVEEISELDDLDFGSLDTNAVYEEEVYEIPW